MWQSSATHDGSETSGEKHHTALRHFRSRSSDWGEFPVACAKCAASPLKWWSFHSDNPHCVYLRFCHICSNASASSTLLISSESWNFRKPFPPWPGTQKNWINESIIKGFISVCSLFVCIKLWNLPSIKEIKTKRKLIRNSNSKRKLIRYKGT